MSDKEFSDRDDRFGLSRFVAAQAPVYAAALAELRSGRKHGHWMWFVFPQMKGLGSSSMAERYGLASLDEARAYLAHPLMGSRLRECVEATLASGARQPQAIFAPPDDLKFHSSLTLFARAAGDGGSVFQRAIERFWSGEPDARTLSLLDAQPH